MIQEESTKHQKYKTTCPYCQCTIDIFPYFTGFDQESGMSYETFFEEFLNQYTLKAGGFVHIPCFIKYHTQREKPKLSLSKEKCLQQIESLKPKVIQKLKEMNPTSRYKLIHYLDRKYNFTQHQPMIFPRLAILLNTINNGTHKKFYDISFSDEEFLSYFYAQESYLQETHQRYQKPTMDPLTPNYNPWACFNYDLAVLGGRAFQYKKQQEADFIRQHNNIKPDISIHNFSLHQENAFVIQKSTKNKTNFLDLFEEIEGR